MTNERALEIFTAKVLATANSPMVFLSRGYVLWLCQLEFHISGKNLRHKFPADYFE